MNRTALLALGILGLGVVGAVALLALQAPDGDPLRTAGAGPAVDEDGRPTDSPGPPDGGADGGGDAGGPSDAAVEEEEAMRPLSREEEARFLAEAGSGAVPWFPPDPARVRDEPLPEFDLEALDEAASLRLGRTVNSMEQVALPAIPRRLCTLQSVLDDLGARTEVPITLADEAFGNEPVVIEAPEGTPLLDVLRMAVHQRQLNLRISADGVEIRD